MAELNPESAYDVILETWSKVTTEERKRLEAIYNREVTEYNELYAEWLYRFDLLQHCPTAEEN